MTLTEKVLRAVADAPGRTVKQIRKALTGAEAPIKKTDVNKILYRAAAVGTIAKASNPKGSAAPVWNPAT